MVDVLSVSGLPDVFDTPVPEAVSAAAPAFFDEHFSDGRFFNPWGRLPRVGPRDLWQWQVSKNPYREAKKTPPRSELQSHPVEAFGSWDPRGRLMWLGHASLLVEVDGVRVLVDPVFGRASPVVPRKVPAPVLPADLPTVHAVAVTHGHYDHLDRASRRSLARRFGEDLVFVVPLGLARSLPAACRRVVELDWWQHIRVGGVGIHLVPAQHWHRRSPLDINRSLWGGVVVTGSRSVYHSGDTGYSEAFGVIGRVFGGLDAAVLPLGAYEPRWFMGEQHMNPAESIQGLLDLGARHFVGMHWGTFDLTDEPLDHGARILLPELVSERGLDPDRVHLLPHGGSLGL